jgi:bifunctional DNA-binding transcriptional regulator/antitoxin component of YhaV-PrlF toxin-antitoxin module
MDCKDKNLKIFWVVTVGTKWQIVIPKEVRDILWIVPWKKFVTILKDNKFLWLVDYSDMDELKNYINIQ